MPSHLSIVLSQLRLELQLVSTIPSLSPLVERKNFTDFVMFKTGKVQFATFAKYVLSASSEDRPQFARCDRVVLAKLSWKSKTNVKMTDAQPPTRVSFVERNAVS